MLTLSATSTSVVASWDTQQRLSYNPNAPRRPGKKPSTLALSPTSQATGNVTLAAPNVRPDQIVSDLLKRRSPSPIEGKPVEPEGLYLGCEQWLPNPPKVQKPRSVFNAASLAYIGDCIYELYARRHFLFPPLNIEEYNDRVMAVVRCEAQDILLQKLLNDNFLTEAERDILRWGKNVGSSKTRTKKRAGAAVYNRASSLETLIGYLYLNNVKRLDEIMQKLGFSTDSSLQLISEESNR
ncbi:uncharacterized protein LOC111016851 isoform X2 [Momordica charantia]|uniref:Uncharacterized protein LOC111016851 isoform X2 n=1 Tax=Momordica charantia TaxID=3673 RepID=A0A6J1D1Y6_MOMCH|nr:uncharacterized protein LOC111016851 isoform X2 [Momordica charantia]